MANTWFVSDTHWGHTNVISYSKRPYSSVQEMNEVLIKNWNSVVDQHDTVWHLGDVSFLNLTETKSILSRLNGNINIILGNHDKVIIKNQEELIANEFVSSIQYYKELKVKNMGTAGLVHDTIILMHYPLRSWNKMHYNSIMLHGHCHGSLQPVGKSVDIGVDAKFIHDEYRPTSLKEVLDYMMKKTFEAIDHHVPRNNKDINK